MINQLRERGQDAQVQIVTETAKGYRIAAKPNPNSGGANHTSTSTHNIGAVFSRTCTISGEGDCPATGNW